MPRGFPGMQYPSSANGATAIVPLYTITVPPSGSATVDIEAGLDATYDNYFVTLSTIKVDTHGVDVSCRFKIAGAYDSAGNYVYHLNSSANGAATYAGASSSSATGVLLAQALGSGSFDHCDLIVEITAPTITNTYKAITSRGIVVTSASTKKAETVGTRNVNGVAIGGLRFYPSSGNFISGTFRLYGIKNS